MAQYPTVELALADLGDPELFARVASILLLDEYPGLQPTGGPGDLGRDAFVRDGLWGDERLVVQYSLNKRWTSKLRAELARYVCDQSLPDRMLFITNCDPQESKVRELRREAMDAHGVRLNVYGRQWLAVRLNSPRHRQTAERLLGVRPTPPNRFSSAADYRRQLSAHVPGFSAALVGAEATVAHLRGALLSGERLVVITGEGGVGKTRLALQAAGDEALVLPPAQAFDDAAVAELQPGVDIVVVLDDAHRLPASGVLRATLNDIRFGRARFILTVRPGLERETLFRAGIAASEVRVVHVGRLPRAAIDQLILSPPHRVLPHDLRLRLIHLAEGRPLIAHMACEAAHRGDLLVSGGETGVLDGYLSRLLDPTWPAYYSDVLVVCAALGGITLDADGDWQALRHALNGRADDELRDALDTLTDHGALAADGNRLAIKPDRLAAWVVADRLLRPDARRRLTWRRSTEALPEPRRQRLVPVLTEAVSLAEGAGRDDLLEQLQLTPWPPPQDADAWLWYRTLLEAAEVARAAPAQVAALLDALIAVWPPAVSHQSTGTILSGELMHPAVEVAAALAAADEPAGLRRMLDLCRLEDTTVRAADSPLGALRNGLAQAEVDWRGDRTQRRTRILALIAAWAGPDPEPRTAAVAARAAGELIAVTFVFSSRAAEDNLKFRTGSWAVDDEPDHARLVLAAAALVAVLVPRLDESGLSGLIVRLEEISSVAGGEKVGQGTEASDWGKELLRAALDLVLLPVLTRFPQLALRLRRKLLAALPDHAGVTAAATGDDELRRYLAVFPLPTGQQLTTPERRMQLRALIDDDGVDACGRLLLAVCCDLDVGRGPTLLASELAERLDEHDAARLVQALVRAGRCAHGTAGALLAPAVTRHPGLIGFVRELAASADAAAVAAAALDSVDVMEERQLVIALGRHDRAVPLAALVAHLAICERLTPHQRGHQLLQLAAAQDDPRLALLGLRELESPGSGGEVGVDASDIPLLAQELDRQLQGATESLLDLQRAFKALAVADIEQMTTLLLTQFDRVLNQAASAPLPRLQAVPEGLRLALLELEDESIEQIVAQISDWLNEQTEDPGWSLVGFWLENLLSSLKPTTGSFVALLGRLADGTARQRMMVIRLLTGRFGEPLWLPTVRVLLAAGMESDERAELLRHLSSGLSFDGSRHEQINGLAEQVLQLRNDPAGTLAAFAQQAHDALRVEAAEEFERERRYHEGY